MLVELKIKNFMSFREETVFSMERSNIDKGTLKENYISEGNLNILKSSIILGPNASGKTNLIQAMHFLKWMVKRSRNFDRKQKIKIFPFKLDPRFREEEPISFGIKFLSNHDLYEYTMELQKTEGGETEYNFVICSEMLRNKNGMIFERKGKEFKFKEKASSNLRTISEMILENSLLLSAYGSNDIPELKEPYKWFDEKLIVNLSDRLERKYLIDNFFDSKDFKGYLQKNLIGSDLGDIAKFDIIEKEMDMEFPENLPDEVKNRILFESKYQIRSFHEDLDNNMIEFDLEMEESKGTQKFIFLMGYLYDIIGNNKVLVIDEMENSLHPELMRLLFHLVHTQGLKAQIISTSHSYSLLQYVNDQDEEIFRRDQVWFTRKRRDMSTQLYSLINIGGIRKDLRIFKAYFDGRLEAFPDVRLTEYVQE